MGGACLKFRLREEEFILLERGINKKGLLKELLRSVKIGVGK